MQKSDIIKLTFATGLLLLLILLQQPIKKWLQPTEFSQKNINQCDLNETNCIISHANYRFLLSLKSKPITLEETEYLNLSVISGVKIDNTMQVSAFIAGKNMVMGKIPILFSRNDNQFIAEFVLGMCIEPKMIWLLTLNIASEHTQTTHMIEFITQH